MRDPQGSYARWADTHVFFDQLHLIAEGAEVLTSRTRRWWEYALNETPNGSLMVKNALFDSLAGDRVLNLLHVTRAAGTIERKAALYPSGGCLVGSVYCAPVTPEQGGLRMHNLGEYLLTREAPASAQRFSSAGEGATPLIIKVAIPSTAYRGLAGIDYLRLGTIHLEIFEQLEYLLSRYERHQLTETIVRRIRNSMSVLNLCHNLLYGGANVDPYEFLEALGNSVDKLPILGYIYFEVLAEYLMLHSTLERTRELRRRGEFDNWLYKEALFTLFPYMAGKFDLSKFHPGQADLRALFPKLGLDPNTPHLVRYLRDRIALLVNARLLAPTPTAIDWRRTQWEFQELRPKLAPLLGHLIHRELRTFGRYPDFYFYYDQHKALQAWNYWNHMDIIAPFNGTFPKGEVGINPAYPDLDYSIYRARLGRDRLLHPEEKLDLRIVPRLVDIKHTVMRGADFVPPQSESG